MMEYSYWSPIAVEYDPIKVGSIDGTDTIPHDRAIVRALNANYRPNKGVIGDPMCTLFVGRLNYVTTESSIKQAFAEYAPVRRVRLIRDIVTGFSKGYAFVEFYDEQTTGRVCRDAAGMQLDEKQLLIDFECERTLTGWVPRRLGGGFGGRKEAGQLRFGGRDRQFRKPIFVGPVIHSRDDKGNTSHREHTVNIDRHREDKGNMHHRERTVNIERHRDDKGNFSHREHTGIADRHRDNRSRSQWSSGRSQEDDKARSETRSRDGDRVNKKFSKSESYNSSRRRSRSRSRSRH